MNNFWTKLPKPFFCLAPLDGVTDVVFRQIIAEIGKPDVFFTEFTSTDGLVSPGKKFVEERLIFKANEQPVVAQVWGTNPENFYLSAKYLQDLGFAGIDINMGCPDRSVIRNKACSALIKNPNLAKEIIEATKKGAPRLPVSVKTRIGFEKQQVEEWIGFLLKQNLAALTVHLRTVSEMSKVPAHWELMPKIIKLRDQISSNTLIIGNGDIKNLKDAYDKQRIYNCDGLMIGRGIFSNPWVFNSSISLQDISPKKRINLFLKHIRLFDKTWKGTKNPEILKKFAKTYIQNFPEAAILREKLMSTKTLKEFTDNINSFTSATRNPID